MKIEITCLNETVEKVADTLSRFGTDFDVIHDGCFSFNIYDRNTLKELSGVRFLYRATARDYVNALSSICRNGKDLIGYKFSNENDVVAHIILTSEHEELNAD